MKPEQSGAQWLADLRQKAEGKVPAENPDAELPASPEEFRQLLQEFRMHQVELEMQNEELRRSQEALEASRSRYFSLYDLAPVGYITLNSDGLILEANLTAATLLGMPRGALILQPLALSIAAEDRDVFYRYRRQLFDSGHPQDCDLRMVRQDNTLIWVRLESKFADVWQSGSSVWRAVLIDISERKRAEEEKRLLQAQLDELQKLECIGRLAGGVAHDFNNILGVILGQAELGLTRVPADQPIHANLLEIRKAAQRSANLTRQLLTFARRQAIQPVVLDLNEHIAGTLQMLRRLIGENINLQNRPGNGLWPIRIDPSQVDQILANLCLNARDAIDGVGTISIETENVFLDEPRSAEMTGASPGEHVALTVADSGSGMSKGTLERIFEPFFTTKEPGRGTGLGLSTVYGIVKQNHGSIHVDSAPGKGATFRIYLPRHAAGAAGAREEEPAQPIQGGSETVLVVEDDAALRSICKLMLVQLGYRVLVAVSPEQGIAMGDVFSGPIHLLLTDVILPEMNGIELSSRLKARHPAMRVLFMSGYAQDLLARGSSKQESIRFIQKPFSMQELAVKIRAALADRSSRQP